VANSLCQGQEKCTIREPETPIANFGVNESAMKILAILAFLSTIFVTQALAQTRHISMVKGSPTNYGPYGFDISWVDNSTQKYYLADRTNNAIDLVDAATDTFVGFIGKGQYSGSRPCRYSSCGTSAKRAALKLSGASHC